MPRTYANSALNSILDRPGFQGSFVRSTGGPGSNAFATGQETGINGDFGASLTAPGFAATGRVSAAMLGTIVGGLVLFHFITRKVQL